MSLNKTKARFDVCLADVCYLRILWNNSMLYIDMAKVCVFLQKSCCYFTIDANHSAVPSEWHCQWFIHINEHVSFEITKAPQKSTVCHFAIDAQTHDDYFLKQIVAFYAYIFTSDIKLFKFHLSPNKLNYFLLVL